MMRGSSLKDHAMSDDAIAQSARMDDAPMDEVRTGEVRTGDVRTGEIRTEGAHVEFAPTAANQRLFRNALGRFATGVAVVTAGAEAGGPVGVTINSFSSVSLDPPLVLWSLARSSSRRARFEAAERTAIHVLAEEQTAICEGFASSASAFDSGDWGGDANGTPLLEGCLARFECRKYATYDGGDHVIFVAEVVKAAMRRGGRPLVFADGGYIRAV